MRIDAIAVGINPPEDVNVIVEVPIGGEPIKYEMDKAAGTLVVEYVETAPSRDAITAQILTAPYHLAAIPKHDGEVRFLKVVK